ncbi:hypothetical protein BpHYR1_002127 [Brachionus plicatilis]|uniref:Uncharacterized protein n=1 Tax=Brachionus plicatilis TaxID=10195 RepID=A0A3M7RX35_BRAPC|nr:hypothetical protein BpHYR1_002127 [Brachionus plicatilis]
MGFKIGLQSTLQFSAFCTPLKSILIIFANAEFLKSHKLNNCQTYRNWLNAFISHLAAAEIEVSITALYVKWLRQYARYTQMSIGVDQPLSLSCLSKNSTRLTIERTRLHWRSRSSESECPKP